MFGLLAAMTSLVFGFVLYRLGRYVKESYDDMKQLVKKKDQEIELLTDLWKIDESEIEWIEPISQGEKPFRRRTLFSATNVLVTVGGYGDVWKCEWREHVVAVKKLLHHWVNSESSLNFHEEIEFLQTIRHPNIVLFYGAGELKVCWTSSF